MLPKSSSDPQEQQQAAGGSGAARLGPRQRTGCAFPPLLAPLVPLGLFAFLVFVWPTVWRYATYEGRGVRIHRLTNEVQFAQKDANGATTFRKFGKNNEPDAHPSSRLPTASDLARVTLRNVRALYGLPRGLITGEAVNTSSQHIVGDVQFNVQVARRGTQPQERTLRASVDWPPHAVSPFELRTSFNLEQGDRVLLQLGPSPLR